MILPEGVYWWRAGARLENGGENFSKPQKFVVLKELSAPQIVLPKADSALVAHNGTPVSISWENVMGADYYNVRVFNSNEELVAQKAAVYGTSVQFALEEAGYSCTVQAVCAETEISPLRASAVSLVSFSVRTPDSIRPVLPQDNIHIQGLTALRNPVAFNWEHGKDVPSSYELVIKKRQANGNYRIVERHTTARQNISIQKLTAGSYSWTVRASTPDGLPLDSKERFFTVEKIPDLTRPVLDLPAASLVMDSDYLRKNRTIYFEWKSVNGATEYDFALYKKMPDGSLKTVYRARKVKASHLRLKNLSMLDHGDFTWTVTAYAFAKDGSLEQQSKAGVSEFKIDFEETDKIKAEQPGRMFSEDEE